MKIGHYEPGEPEPFSIESFIESWVLTRDAAQATVDQANKEIEKLGKLLHKEYNKPPSQ